MTMITMFFGRNSKQTNYNVLWTEFKIEKKASELLLEISQTFFAWFVSILWSAL